MEILNHKDERTMPAVVQHKVSQECKGPDLTLLRTERVFKKLVLG
jgi:hypothetical protein